MIAPNKLPVAPRPIATESMSSWFLRVAASNFVSVDELLQAFASQYSGLLGGGIPEHSFSDAAVSGLSRFCRVAPKHIYAMDLRRRISDFDPSLLLSFSRAHSAIPGRINRRAHYTFCLPCIQEKQVVHIRWEWTLACFLQCPLHRTALLDRCTVCEQPDPLIFSEPDAKPEYCCRSCGAFLTEEPDQKSKPADRELVMTVEQSLREALLGKDPHPELLGPISAQCLRRFVQDVLTVLTDSLSRFDPKSSGYCSREDILLVMTALIGNALPAANLAKRRQLCQRGTRLWANLLAVLPSLAGSQLENASLRWPPTLRRRFIAGLRLRIRKRWPYNPYRPAKDRERRTERRELAGVFPLPLKRK